MTVCDREMFDALPPLQAEDFVRLPAGSRVSLYLLEHIELGKSVVFAVEYVHRELIYRSPGQKDAVAFGEGRLVDGAASSTDVRILFSRFQRTATLRGLKLEGQVKALADGPLKARASVQG